MAYGDAWFTRELIYVFMCLFVLLWAFCVCVFCFVLGVGVGEGGVIIEARTDYL